MVVVVVMIVIDTYCLEYHLRALLLVKDSDEMYGSMKDPFIVSMSVTQEIVGWSPLKLSSKGAVSGSVMIS